MLTLDRLFAEHVATGLARQMALGDVIGERGWQLDLTRGTVTVCDDLRYHVQLLGTESDEAGNWLWAWANEASEIPPALLRLSGWLREYGHRHEVAELTEPTFALRRADGHRLALLASGLTGRCYYRGPYPGGAVFFRLDDAPPQITVPIRPERVPSVLGQVIQSFPVDHRIAVDSFLRGNGPTWPATSSPTRPCWPASSGPEDTPRGSRNAMTARPVGSRVTASGRAPSTEPGILLAGDKCARMRSLAWHGVRGYARPIEDRLSKRTAVQCAVARTIL
ncbi:DUF6882 domain-containing protein [Micromonospora sp. C31]|uniref:DUF6882 domain-containing protein n=1 Tax=Micromonospora sp. C31 TaxID=2824876 RepID=UPI001FFCE48A|nr:DUF6882 domain-containing protein [Micromonospora sp. C31]